MLGGRFSKFKERASELYQVALETAAAEEENEKCEAELARKKAAEVFGRGTENVTQESGLERDEGLHRSADEIDSDVVVHSPVDSDRLTVVSLTGGSDSELLRKRVERLESELALKADELLEVEKKLKRAEQNGINSNRIPTSKDPDGNLQAMQALLSQKESELHMLDVERKNFKREVNSLEKLVESKDKEVKAARSDLEELTDEFVGMQNKLEDAEARLLRAGGALSDQSSPPQFLSGAELSPRLASLQKEVRILEKERDDAKERASKASELAQITSEESDSILKERDVALAKLREAQIRAEESYVIAENAREGLLQAEKLIEEKTQEVELAQAALKSVQSGVIPGEESRAVDENSLMEKEAEIQDLHRKLGEAEGKIETLSNDKKDVTAYLQTARRDRDRIANELEVTQAQIEDFGTELRGRESEIGKHKMLIEEIQQEKNHLMQKEAELMDQVSSLRAAAEELEATKARASKSEERLKADLESSYEEVERVKQNLLESSTRAGVQLRELESSGRENLELKDELLKLKMSGKDMTRRLEEEIASAAEAEEKVKTQSRMVESSAQEIKELKEQIIKLRSEVEDLGKRLQAETSISDQLKDKLYNSDQELAEASLELQRMRAQMSEGADAKAEEERLLKELESSKAMVSALENQATESLADSQRAAGDLEMEKSMAAELELQLKTARDQILDLGKELEIARSRTDSKSADLVAKLRNDLETEKKIAEAKHLALARAMDDVLELKNQLERGGSISQEQSGEMNNEASQDESERLAAELEVERQRSEQLAIEVESRKSELLEVGLELNNSRTARNVLDDKLHEAESRFSALVLESEKQTAAVAASRAERDSHISALQQQIQELEGHLLDERERRDVLREGPGETEQDRVADLNLRLEEADHSRKRMEARIQFLGEELHRTQATLDQERVRGDENELAAARARRSLQENVVVTPSPRRATSTPDDSKSLTLGQMLRRLVQEDRGSNVDEESLVFERLI
ncbi:hypothetical protein NDN08_008362 [Rhodosorus marinus]|uniref:GRIP domain-containing protein n=1 Tax=Rhodosorus marinus TaxID=101924 RepID=A0AAV8V0C3_9RHOD|nr:hypothetical protein NDN08_008362 [Rhodosorus marinus]